MNFSPHTKKVYWRLTQLIPSKILKRGLTVKRRVFLRFPLKISFILLHQKGEKEEKTSGQAG